MQSAIVSDSREPAEYRHTLAALAQGRGIRLATERLDSGDYLWTLPDGRLVVVERKEISDLINSLGDGRWATQVAKMRHHDLPFLLLDGALKIRGDGTVIGGNNVTPAARVDGAIVAAQLAGLMVVHAGAGPSAVGKRLVEVYEQTHREQHASLARPKPRIKAGNPTEAEALAVLAALPGSGQKTAARLIQAHGSVRGAMESIWTLQTEVVSGKKAESWKGVLEWQISNNSETP